MANQAVVSFARRKLEDSLNKLKAEKETDLSMTRERRQEVNKAIEICEKCLKNGEVLDAWIDRLQAKTIH